MVLSPIVVFYLMLAAIATVTLMLFLMIRKRSENPGSASVAASSEEGISEIEAEREALRFELWGYRRRPAAVVALLLLFNGVVALVSSIVLVSSILAFIGLGLTFWGALLLFVRPVRYVRSELLDSTPMLSLKDIDSILGHLGYEGKPMYLPPLYLRGVRGGTVFVPAKDETVIPQAEERAKNLVFLSNPEGVCLTPPGLGLANLFEDELGVNFSQVDLDYLRSRLPGLLIEGLELVEDFEMRVGEDVIDIKVTGSVYGALCSEVEKMPHIGRYVGCPLCSSIACALARITHVPIAIEETSVSNDGRMAEVRYRVLG